MAFNPDDYVRALGSIGDPDKIDRLFNHIATLPAEQSDAALKAIEKSIVRDWQASAPTPDELADLRRVVEAVDDLKGTEQGEKIRNAMASKMDGFETQTRVLSRIFANVAEKRGDQAHPLVKIYVDAEYRIPLDEITTGFGQAKLMVAVEQHLQELAGKAPGKPAPAPKKGGQSFDL